MTHNLDIPIYNTHVLFLLDSSPEELKMIYENNPNKMTEEEYKSCLEDINDECSCDGFTMETSLWDYIVYFRTPLCRNSVIHELFHLTNLILYKRHVAYSKEAEAWAYLIGWLADEYYDNILEKYNKEKEKDNKKTKKK